MAKESRKVVKLLDTCPKYNNDEKMVFVCYCNHQFNSSKGLLSHFNSHTELKVSCVENNCPYKFKNKSEMLIHVDDKHRTYNNHKSFSSKCNVPINAKLYSVADLQVATNSFSEENFIGEGSLGSVFKAELPDGDIFAVKNVDTVPLSLNEEKKVLSVIWNISRLKHPNIVSLVGYCVEKGQKLLVYEYLDQFNLEETLHCGTYSSLSWKIRLQIALGVACGIDYLHSCIPPVTHSNLKASNILLDEDFMPRICDSGLSVLRSLTSNNVKLKASEMAIADSGYIAPEHCQGGVNSTKADVYAFGVLLLELLTGRKPFDGTKPRDEQYLVKWACTRLHDSESLIQMVDPSVKKSIGSKGLSRFADIVSLCIQPEKELHPMMSKIVELLEDLSIEEY